MAAPSNPEQLIRDLNADSAVVAVATAHLRGDGDRTLLLARDHLAEHPDSLLVAHIAALAAQR